MVYSCSRLQCLVACEVLVQEPPWRVSLQTGHGGLRKNVAAVPTPIALAPDFVGSGLARGTARSQSNGAGCSGRG